MLEQLVKKWFRGELLDDRTDYALFCSALVENRTPILRRKVVSVDLLVCLKNDVVNFQAMASSVLKYLETDRSTPRRVTAVWLVVSPRGGIYLYETIACKETLRYRGMKNRFLVFNSLDGSFSFGPGHIYNQAYTERMKNFMLHEKLLSENEKLNVFTKIMKSSLASVRQGCFVHP